MTSHEQFIAQRNRSLKGGVLTLCALVLMLGVPLAIAHAVLVVPPVPPTLENVKK